MSDPAPLRPAPAAAAPALRRVRVGTAVAVAVVVLAAAAIWGTRAVLVAPFAPFGIAEWVKALVYDGNGFAMGTTMWWVSGLACVLFVLSLRGLLRSRNPARALACAVVFVLLLALGVSGCAHHEPPSLLTR